MRGFFARAAIVLLGLLPTRVLSADVLSTDGYSSCLANSDIQFQRLDATFDRSTGVVNFDVQGTNSKAQNVTGLVTVYAYGHQVYTTDFDPCSPDHYIEQLCPGKRARP